MQKLLSVTEMHSVNNCVTFHGAVDNNNGTVSSNLEISDLYFKDSSPALLSCSFHQYNNIWAS